MPKILIVDDEEDQEELIRQRLIKKDFLQEYEFLFVRNGKEALQKIKIHPDIEIALVDVNMPEMDGFTLIQKSKALNPVLSIILISAYDDDTNISMGLSYGAFDFINKPIDFNLLEKSLKRIIIHVNQLKLAIHSKQV
jgi:YesN/AraC family two-component response regulator